jgi:aconitate hydratase
MINGLGVVAWGVGGIEAEAGMLGQPVYFLTPDVGRRRLTRHRPPGITATDIVLTLTEMLRKAKVVGKFVELLRRGRRATAGHRPRATIANMALRNTAPRWASSRSTRPPAQYYLATGRDPAQVDTLRNYFKAQDLFGIPKPAASNTARP